MPDFRAAQAGDLDGILALYRQLHPADPPAVDAGRRGTGLGKQIMAGTLRAAWDAGCYKVMLQTGSRRESTHAFYRSCGFDPDEKTAYVSHPA